MPSLIYIARIKRSSDELIQGLQAAGFHVESFKPGEITADECLLVMTSEAVDAKINPENSLIAPAHPAEMTREPGGIPPLPNLNEQLGSQAAIWNRIKAAAGEEPANKSAPGGPGGTTHIPPSLGPETVELGFIPSEVGRRAVANSRRKSSATIERPTVAREPAASSGRTGFSRLLFPTLERAGIKSSVSSPEISPGGKTGQSNEPYYRLFLRPLPAAVAVLILAISFLIYQVSTLPSTTAASSGHEASQSATSHSDSTDSLVTVSALPPRQNGRRPKTPLIVSSADSPKSSVRRHLSDDGFVAEDFTNHFDLHAHAATTAQNPGLKRNAQGGSKQKRIVVN